MRKETQIHLCKILRYLVYQQLLDQISQVAKMSNETNFARSGLIRRLFLEDGGEVTSIRQLKSDIVLFASYGEKWSTKQGTHQGHF